MKLFAVVWKLSDEPYLGARNHLYITYDFVDKFVPLYSNKALEHLVVL